MTFDFSGQRVEVSGGLAAAAATLGGIDVWVHNALGFVADDDEAHWALGLSVGVMVRVRASHATLPALRPGAPTRRVSSGSGWMPSTRAPACAAVKLAKRRHTRSQAAMLAVDGGQVLGAA